MLYTQETKQPHAENEYIEMTGYERYKRQCAIVESCPGTKMRKVFLIVIIAYTILLSVGILIAFLLSLIPGSNALSPAVFFGVFDAFALIATLLLKSQRRKTFHIRD